MNFILPFKSKQFLTRKQNDKNNLQYYKIKVKPWKCLRNMKSYRHADLTW